MTIFDKSFREIWIFGSVHNEDEIFKVIKIVQFSAESQLLSHTAVLIREWAVRIVGVSVLLGVFIVSVIAGLVGFWWPVWSRVPSCTRSSCRDRGEVGLWCVGGEGRVLAVVGVVSSSQEWGVCRRVNKRLIMGSSPGCQFWFFSFSFPTSSTTNWVLSRTKIDAGDGPEKLKSSYRI